MPTRMSETVEGRCDAGAVGESLSEPKHPIFADVINLARIGALLSRPFFQKYASDYNLSLNEWRVIVVVHDRPGTSGQEVGRLAGIIPMNVSRAVATLKKTGRIRSEADPENHRRQMLYLTDGGEALYQQLYPQARAHAEKLFDVFSEDERKEFSEMLQRLYDRAEELLGD